MLSKFGYLSQTEGLCRLLLGTLRNVPRDAQADFRWINGEPGLVFYWDAHPQSVLVLTPDPDSVEGIHIVVNPDKLAHLRPAAG